MNSPGEHNLQLMLSNLSPTVDPSEYVFCSTDKDVPIVEVVSMIRESEGVSVVVKKEYADKAGLSYSGTFSWITLTVHSSLEAVGLTAAFSTALARASISCNVVAGYYHDHIFVPTMDEKIAIEVMSLLSKEHN
jgi:uncharacterized protein